MTLKDSVALVTGAGRGIGRTIALSLARQGASVVATSRTLSELEKLKGEIASSEGRATILGADLTDDTAVEKLFGEISSRFSRLDILVNNAGIGLFSPVRELALADFDRMWNLNMRAVMVCTQHALKLMEPQNGGAIVNVASLAGRNAFVGGAGYAATK